MKRLAYCGVAGVKAWMVTVGGTLKLFPLLSVSSTVNCLKSHSMHPFHFLKRLFEKPSKSIIRFKNIKSLQ